MSLLSCCIRQSGALVVRAAEWFLHQLLPEPRLVSCPVVLLNGLPLRHDGASNQRVWSKLAEFRCHRTRFCGVQNSDVGARVRLRTKDSVWSGIANSLNDSANRHISSSSQLRGATEDYKVRMNAVEQVS